MKEKLAETTKQIVAGHSELTLTDVSFSSKYLPLEAFVKSWDGEPPEPNADGTRPLVQTPAWLTKLKVVIFERCVLTESTFQDRDANLSGFVFLCKALERSEVEEIRFKDCILGPK